MEYVKNLFEKLGEQINNLSNRVRRLEKLPLKVYTATRVLYAGADGFPAEDADLTYNDSTNTLTVTNITVQAWQTPTLLNSWQNYGGAYDTSGYIKDPFGIVHLKGLIRFGTATIGTVLFTLPAGYRPGATLIFTSAGFDGTSPAASRIDISSNGNVAIHHGTNDYLSLSGISFRAA